MSGQQALRSFDRAAGRYSGGAQIQQEIARKLAAMISPAAAGPALDIGCGTGFLTAAVSERFPGMIIDAIDISPQMIGQAELEHPGLETASWMTADALRYAREGYYRLAVTSSALQWIRPFSLLFENIRRNMTAGGLLYAAVMTAGTLAELHEARAVAAPRKLPKQKLPALEELLAALEGARFKIESAEEIDYTALYSNAGSFLKEIHALGFTGGDLSHGAKLLNRSELAALIEWYERNYRSEHGLVRASFRSCFVAASC